MATFLREDFSALVLWNQRPFAFGHGQRRGRHCRTEATSRMFASTILSKAGSHKMSLRRPLHSKTVRDQGIVTRPPQRKSGQRLVDIQRYFTPEEVRSRPPPRTSRKCIPHSRNRRSVQGRARPVLVSTRTRSGSLPSLSDFFMRMPLGMNNGDRRSRRIARSNGRY